MQFYYNSLRDSFGVAFIPLKAMGGRQDEVRVHQDSTALRIYLITKFLTVHEGHKYLRSP